MNLSALKDFIKNNEIKMVVLLLFLISVSYFFYFYHNNQLLLIGDSLSRLNISRKIVDNLTPGFAQLGNVWLPLPQLLMLPFIWNSFLWHSGMAGSFVSMIAFILGGVYLYKAAKLLTNSSLASILSLSVYGLNINLLYLQTTAMSEPLFLCSVAASMYYFIAWIKSENSIQNLFMASIAVSAASLIRYEALALLFTAIPMVFLYTQLKTKKYNHAESNTILFASLACLGFLFWTIYLTMIFGDPLYWKNYYAGAQTTDSGEKIYAQGKSLFSAIWVYFTATVWMNGLIPTLLSLIAIPFLIYKSIKKKVFLYLPIILSFSLFAFMVLTLMRNTPIKQPDLNLANIFDPAIFKFAEFNIRYGLIMLPTITLLCALLFGIRSTALKLFIFALISVQFLTYYYPGVVLIFQIPINISGQTIQGSAKEKAMMEYMKQNYNNDGLIMISALKHDPQMFQIGADYKSYIHEGTGKYWKESQTNPQRYASWIVFDLDNNDDQVTKYLKNSPNLDLYYNRIYEDKGMYIYKIKTKPEIIVKN